MRLVGILITGNYGNTRGQVGFRQKKPSVILDDTKRRRLGVFIDNTKTLGVFMDETLHSCPTSRCLACLSDLQHNPRRERCNSPEHQTSNRVSSQAFCSKIAAGFSKKLMRNFFFLRLVKPTWRLIISKLNG
uniref:Uncharacterized protein n=1 Tax=Phlegmariurus squarrosus TaxID=73615 RepID=H9M8B7_PHLSQ|nr:hypothetical protein HusqMp58 [Phlegmariurus squarrosus]AEV55824.1 hypothetical protein HusqMp58 [Phlegmariurus squarrosus]